MVTVKEADAGMNDAGHRISSSPGTVVVLGIPFNDVSFAEAVEWVRQRIHAQRPSYIATANMDFLMQAWHDPELQRILLEADMVVADGIPIVWLSRLLGPPLRERVTGSDLVPLFAEMAAREGFSMFGLGGAPGVAERAMAKLAERCPGLRIAGCYSPPKADILDMDNAGMLARIKEVSPDILLVAFGAPKQEKWVNMHIRRWQVPVAMGVGGSLDFLAGAQKRAPRWIQKLALEWLWRMLSDPRRLLRRYVANMGFLFSTACRLFLLRYGPLPASARRSTPSVDQPTTDAAGVRWVAFPGTANDEDSDLFRTTCEADNDRPLLVDTVGRDWLNSRELGELLDLSRHCRSAKRHMCMVVTHPRLMHMLRYIRLDRYVDMAADRPDALRILQSWNLVRENGDLQLEQDRRLRIVLPAELTAANVPEFRTRVEEAWQAAEKRGGPAGIVVDASGVQFLDSAALGFLVALRKKALPLSDGFRCAGFKGAARQTLAIARMEPLFMDNAPSSGGAA